LVLLDIYNLEVARARVLNENLDDSVNNLKDLFLLCKSMFIHVRKTQAETHVPVIESFL
jgi:hypothetical protein